MTWRHGVQVEDFLAAGYRVLRSTNRGIGASSKPAGPYSSRMLADDARRWSDSLGITDFPPDGGLHGRDDRQE